ncbi:hypothetical protein ACWEP4_31890 [Streptomyces sp. NPDC004227]
MPATRGHLEAVHLDQDGGDGWTVNTERHWRARGFRPMGRELVVDKRVADQGPPRARLTGSTTPPVLLVTLSETDAVPSVGRPLSYSLTVRWRTANCSPGGQPWCCRPSDRSPEDQPVAVRLCGPHPDAGANPRIRSNPYTTSLDATPADLCVFDVTALTSHLPRIQCADFALDATR